jgi:ATP-dependent exoDNAse (exonuclease V) beta subunit
MILGMKLTSSQHLALQLDRNILIEAGAGSGKTTIMVERFFQLLRLGPEIDPESILVITFTNLAANELKDRVYHRLRENTHGLSPMQSSRLLSRIHRLSFFTIDGFCANLLRDLVLYTPIDPGFSVISAEESRLRYTESIETTLRQLAHANDSNYFALVTVYSKYQISTFLNQLAHVLLTQNQIHTQDTLYQALRASLESPLDRECGETEIGLTQALLVIHAHVQKCYAQEKCKDGVLDFTDLLTHTQTVLLNQHAQQRMKHRYSSIFVDEFQDTSRIQWEIIQQLCDAYRPFSEKKLCIVGDMKQSIYRFRGAEPYLFQSLLSQPHADNETQIIHMADNFRSAPEIIRFVNDLFSRLFANATRPIPYTPLTAHQTNRGDVLISMVPKPLTPADECQRIGAWIMAKHQTGIGWNDMAVLSRKRSDLTRLSHVLNASGIPVILHGESDFFQRQSSIDLTNLALMLLNPHDSLSMAAVLVSPLVQLSHVVLRMLCESGPDLYDTFTQLHRGRYPQNWSVLDIAVQNTVTTVAGTILKWVNDARYQSLYDAMMAIIYQTGCFTSAEISHVMAYVQTLESFNQSRAVMVTQLRQLSAQRSNYTNAELESGVHLLTIHQSKGLEFEAVVVMGCHRKFNFLSDTLIVSPHGIGLSLPQSQIQRGVQSEMGRTASLKKMLQSQNQPDIVAEEIRLFYVACTRAKTHLLLSGMNPKSTDETRPSCIFDFLETWMTVCPTGRRLNDIDYSFYQPDVSGVLTRSVVTEEPKGPIATNTVDMKMTPLTMTNTLTLIQSFSVGDVALILSCPQKYHQKSLLQLIQSQGKESIDLAQKTSVRMGKVIHQAVAYWIRHRVSWEDAIAIAYDTWLPAYPIDDRDALSKIFSDLSPYTTHTALTEWPFNLYIGPSFRVNGRIDLVSIRPQNITVLDIKTDHIHDPTDESALATVADRYRHQLAIYTLAVMAHTKRPITDIVCQLYFTSCHRFYPISLSSEMLDALATQISTALTQIGHTTDSFYPISDDYKSHAMTSPRPCHTCPIATVRPVCAKLN